MMGLISGHKEEEISKPHIKWVAPNKGDMEPSSCCKGVSPARNVLLCHTIGNKLTLKRREHTSTCLPHSADILKLLVHTFRRAECKIVLLATYHHRLLCCLASQPCIIIMHASSH